MDKAAHLKKLRETFNEFFQALEELPGDEALLSDDPRITRLAETMWKATAEMLAWGMTFNAWLKTSIPDPGRGAK